ncbi:hypothetical protein PENSPDRAFT_278986 [Peniophora sp. CONT]|nr:hypothetical protein PENSPDRAFT_278986 [Peniophora sp. CONT]
MLDASVLWSWWREGVEGLRIPQVRSASLRPTPPLYHRFSVVIHYGHSHRREPRARAQALQSNCSYAFPAQPCVVATVNIPRPSPWLEIAAVARCTHARIHPLYPTFPQWASSKRHPWLPWLRRHRCLNSLPKCDAATCVSRMTRLRNDHMLLAPVASRVRGSSPSLHRFGRRDGYVVPHGVPRESNVEEIGDGMKFTEI